MKSNSKKIVILIILAIGFVFLPNMMLDFGDGQKTNVINPKESFKKNLIFYLVAIITLLFKYSILFYLFKNILSF